MYLKNVKNDFLKKWADKKIKFLVLTLSICLVISFTGYIFLINVISVKGYEIKELDKKISQLKKDYKGLQVKEAYLRSMPRVEAGINCLHMELVDSEEYFDLAKLMMAKR